MKRNELIQMKALDIAELRGKAKSLKDEVASLVIDKNTNKLKDKKAIFKKRKNLAQVMTILRQKELLVELEGKA